MDHLLLEPFDCRVVPNAFSRKKKKISYFRLVRQPPSMKTLVDLFHGEELRFIWTSDCSFLRLSSSRPPENYKRERPDNYETIFGTVELIDRAGQQYFLCIYASTLKAAKACLNRLCTVDDDHFVSFSNISWSFIDEEVEMYPSTMIPYPHSRNALELLGCSSPKRQVSFELMTFWGDRAMPLVKPGGSLRFDNCWFHDDEGDGDGDEFVNALKAFQDDEQLKRLTCVGDYPLPAYKLWESDAITRIEHIVLEGFCLYDQNETVETVGKVENITFVDCTGIGTVSPTLLENLASSTRLRSLTFQLGWAENLVDENQFLWMEFFRSLRQQRTLERLVFSGYAFPSNEIEELLLSIHHIPTLRHLTLSLEYLCSEEWNKYLSILSRNRYLRSLDFEKILDSEEEKVDGCLMKELTHSLSRFIRQNQNIESAKYNASVFDQEIWNAKVVPVLDYNRYRPKFLLIPSIRKNRAAILGASLASVSARPHLIWMLVKSNQDTLAHQFENAVRHHQLSSPRKRQRI